MQKSSKVIVTDSSCFIILQKINALFILKELFQFVLTTPEGQIEFGYPLPSWVIVESVTDKSLLKKYNQFVDRGEASAMVLAREVNSDYIILDDKEARKFAEKLGLNVKGTMGILLIARQKELIPSLKHYLDLVQLTNFRVSKAIIEGLLKDAGE